MNVMLKIESNYFEQVFFSVLVDVVGYVQDIEKVFSIIVNMKKEGLKFGVVVYSFFMGVCSNVIY